MLTKHTILLVTFVECLEKPNHYLCIANTHLYFHPLGNVIRLLQVEIILRAIYSLMEKFKRFVAGDRDEESPKIAVVLAGDFNSCPCIAPYNYLVTGSIKKEDPEWMSYKSPKLAVCGCISDFEALSLEVEEEEMHKESGNPVTLLSHNPVEMNKENYVPGDCEPVQESDTEKQKQGAESANSSDSNVWPKRTRTVPAPDTFDGLNLSHQFHLLNATGTADPTNICVGFQGVLDYIFIDSDHLAVERHVPFPPMEEVTQFVALPSVYFPSDHLALVTDLKWK